MICAVKFEKNIFFVDNTKKTILETLCNAMSPIW